MPVEYRWYSIRLETYSFFDPESCCNSGVYFEAIYSKMFTTQNGVIGKPLPLGASLLYFLSPLLAQHFIAWNWNRVTPSLYVLEQPAAKQRLTIIFNTNSCNTANTVISCICTVLRIPLAT